MQLKEMDEENPQIAMAPMIDIVFQLIIFFMVVSTFNSLETVEGIDLPVASYSKEKEAMPGELIINLRKNGVAILNQREYSIEELNGVIYQATGNNPGIDFTASIRADANVSFGQVLKVIGICSQAGIIKTSFIALPSEGK